MSFAGGGGLSTREVTVAGSSVPPWFGLAVYFNGRNLVTQLPVLAHVAVGTKGHQVIERVVAQLAPLDLMVDLQVLNRPALLASPFFPAVATTT